MNHRRLCRLFFSLYIFIDLKRKFGDSSVIFETNRLVEGSDEQLNQCTVLHQGNALDESVDCQIKLRHLRVIDEYTRWVDDVRNPEVWAQSVFTKDAIFQNGNMHPAKGRDEIAGRAKFMYSMITSLKHKTTSIHHIHKDLVVTQGDVTYTNKNGRLLEPISICRFFHLDPNSDLITFYRSYMDPTPLIISNGMEILENIEGKQIIQPRKI